MDEKELQENVSYTPQQDTRWGSGGTERGSGAVIFKKENMQKNHLFGGHKMTSACISTAHPSLVQAGIP